MDSEANHVAAWINSELATWAERVSDPESARIYPGSDLAQDQLLPDGVPQGLLAWRALGTAGEHAGAAHFMVTKSDGGVFAKPFLTLSRTVMLGAARALYMLEPDNPARRHSRSLQLLRTEAQDTQNLVRNWEDPAEDGGGELSEIRQASDAFREECEQALQQAGLPARSEMKDGALLRTAAPHIADYVHPDIDALQVVWHFWNLSSATAHARAWAWSEGIEDRPAIVQFCNIWAGPLGLLDKAWDRWNARRTPS